MDSKNRTALYLACMDCNIHLLKWLMEKNADPRIAYVIDEKTEDEPAAGEDEYLSLNSTMAEIQATQEGAALLEQMMKQMQGSVAGGMGKNVKIPKAMMAMIARQPLKKLLAQGGIDAEGEQAKMLAAALGRIRRK